MTLKQSKMLTLSHMPFHHSHIWVTIKGMADLNTEEFSYKHELKNIVREYFERFPNLSINAMANRSDVPVSTLRRLLKSETPIELAPHLTLNLLSYIYKEKHFTKLVHKVPESLSEFLIKHFGNFVFDNDSYELNIDLNKELSDPIKYFIYKLASNSNGVSLTEISELYGNFGKEKLDELCKLDLFNYERGRFYAKKSNFSLDINTMAKHLPMLVSKYRPEKLNEGANLCYSFSESLNEEGITMAKEIKKKAIKEIMELFNNSKFHGEIPYFSIFLSEKLFYSESEGELQ